MPGSAHLPDTNQIENDFTKIAGFTDSPTVQNRLCEQAILIDGVLTNGFAELLAGDMLLRFVVIEIGIQIKLGQAFRRLALGGGSVSKTLCA